MPKFGQKSHLNLASVFILSSQKYSIFSLDISVMTGPDPREYIPGSPDHQLFSFRIYEAKFWALRGQIIEIYTVSLLSFSSA